LIEDLDYSFTTARYVHRTLSKAFEDAVNVYEVLSRNPARKVPAPKVDEFEPVVIRTSDDLYSLLSAAASSIHFPLIVFLLATGLRRSEALGLRWRDVDFERRTLSVTKQLKRNRKGQLGRHKTKTKKTRTVRLSVTAIQALKLQQKNQVNWQLICGSAWRNEEGYIFTRQDGSPIHPDAFTHEFTRIARQAGLDGLTPHSLRHTCATFLLEADQHPKKAAAMMGHSLEILLERYSHISVQMQEGLAECIDQKLLPTVKEFLSEEKKAGCVCKNALATGHTEP